MEALSAGIEVAYAWLTRLHPPDFAPLNPDAFSESFSKH